MMEYGKPVIWTFALAWVLSSVASAQTTDRIKTIDGRTYRGRVTRMSATEVGLRRGTVAQPMAEQTVAANEIESIAYAGEPRPLAMARTYIGVGRYEKAIAALDEIAEQAIDRDYVKQDVQFYRALCESRLALQGTGKPSTAGRAMHRLTSDAQWRENYHYFDACATLGELLAADKKYDKAIEYYGRLVKAPWADQKMRGQALTGRALLAQKKYAKAIAEFDQVLANSADSQAAAKQQVEARLDKAICLAATDDAAAGIELITQVLQQADADDDQTRAAAFRTRGHCHLQVGQKKDALLDFLHIDLLYNRDPEMHAEALYQLAKLWPSVGKGQRGREATTTLKERYPDSRWASKEPDTEPGGGGRGAF